MLVVGLFQMSHERDNGDFVLCYSIVPLVVDLVAELLAACAIEVVFRQHDLDCYHVSREAPYQRDVDLDLSVVDYTHYGHL